VGCLAQPFEADFGSETSKKETFRPNLGFDHRQKREVIIHEENMAQEVGVADSAPLLRGRERDEGKGMGCLGSIPLIFKESEI